MFSYRNILSLTRGNGMRAPRCLLLSGLACACFAVSALGAEPAKEGTSLRLDETRHIVDLTQAAWEYHATDAEKDVDYQEVAAVEDWKPISVGKRWERLGHPELNGKTVWIRLKFHVPAEVKRCRIGFFCSSLDDEADFYVNGSRVGSAKYILQYCIPGPTDIDLTPKVHFGGENLLVVKVKDHTKKIGRGGGVYGNVCLYKTLPFDRTAEGGIVLSGKAAGKYSVLLHLGDAVLSRGEQTRFSSDELHQLEVPPYILRQDELILVAAAESVSSPDRLHRVDLNDVNRTTDSSPLTLRCGELPDHLGQYELLEIPLEVSGSYRNPFDPKQINVQAFVETPSGRIEKVPAFFSQDFRAIAVGEDEEILLPKRGNPWKLYYRPREIGIHKVELFAQDKTGLCHLKARPFEVVKSTRKGFLRISKHDPRFFEFDNGDSFFGTGPSGWFRDANFFFGGNTRWVTTRRMDDYYQRKGANGCSLEYLCSFFYGRLYLPGGFIDQHVAWKVEHGVRTMEKHGIYWIVFYDEVRRYHGYGFDTLPYSVARGGPCRTTLEIYFNRRALETQKNQLRYLISRISDSPSVWIWNCGDEAQPGNRFSKPLVRSWLKELHAYIRANDVYRHPHAIGEGYHAVLDGTDVVLVPDWYFRDKPRGGGKGRYSCDRHQDAVSLSECLMDKFDGFSGPVIIPEGGPGEWNDSYYLSGEHWDFPEAASFHNHLWISLFLKYAGGGTAWLCNVLDSKNHLFHAAALERYIEDESLTKPKWEIKTAEVSDANLRSFVLQSADKCLVWVQNKHYTWYNVGVRKLTPKAITGASITVPVRKDGAYRIQLWDTRSGKITREDTVEATVKKVVYGLPDILADVALKVIHQPAIEER